VYVYRNQTVMPLYLLAADYDRFLNLHGEPGARLDSCQSIYTPEPERDSILMKVLSPLMIYGPEIHLRRLEKITIDYMVNKGRTWKVFSEKIFEEWKESILYASFFPFASVHNDCLMVFQIGDSYFKRQCRVLGNPECRREREFPSAE
jgi:hypothetical protein